MELKRHIERMQKGDAELFFDLFENKLIYDKQQKTWYIFNGHIWEEDVYDQAFNLVEVLAEKYESELLPTIDPTHTKLRNFVDRRIKGLRCINTMEKVLKTASNLMPLKHKWNRDPYLLAVKNGVLNLKTGELETGKPEHYINCAAQTEWKGYAEPCSRWEQFLNELFPTKPEVITFLQRLFGYAISGLNVEHVMPVLFGEKGRNGKDVMMTTLCNVLGDTMSSTTSKEILLSGLKNPGAAAPFLYELKGKRLVYADETSEGAGFDEAQIKMLTGGAKLQAKRLYAQPTTIEPEYLLVLMTNHRPNVDANDEAMWERLILIEFDQRFVDNPEYDNEHPQDKFLKYKLDEERSGILAWLVAGFSEWQKQGLAIPDAVKFTTTNYRNDQDSLGRFLEKECLVDEESKINVTDMYQTYQRWADLDGTKKLNRNEFSRKMATKPFEKKRYSNGYYYLGIRLKPTVEEEMEQYLAMIKTESN